MKADHRGPGSFEAVPVPPDGYVPGRLVSYRTLDSIRAAALTAAVEFKRYSATADMDVNKVLAVAKEFEQYLTGEEANDAVQRG